MDIVKMLYYDKIDVSERIDVNKTKESKEYDIFHYWYLLNKGLQLKPNACNGVYES